MSTLHSPTQATPSESPTQRLARGQQQFIELWGQMAGNWGVPRSMAEVHALLFIDGAPMNTDDIMARLGISRGNASMTLRTLEEWGIVRRDHRKEDRKDYFVAEQDVRTLFATVICARKRREIDPLLERLTLCRQTTDVDGEALASHNRKLDEMLEFVRAFDALTSHFLGGGGSGLGAALNALRGAP